MFISSPKISKVDLSKMVDQMVSNKLNSLSALLDGVSLEELTNFAVPLTGQQTQDQLHDGVLLGYRDGKLVEENNLNGGTF
jgi:hypothetical protein